MQLRTVQLTSNVMSTSARLALNPHLTHTQTMHISQVLQCLASTRIHHSRVSFHKGCGLSCSLILYPLLLVLAKDLGLVIMQQHNIICLSYLCATKENNSHVNQSLMTMCEKAGRIRRIRQIRDDLHGQEPSTYCISVTNCHVVYSLTTVLVVRGYHASGLHQLCYLKCFR